MANFPNSVWSPTTKSNGQTIDASHINDAQAEVVAIEDGYRNATAPLNSSGSTVRTLSVLGNSTLASSVTFGTIPYVFPSSGPSSGQVLTCISTSGSTAGLEWRTPTGPVLLGAANGTSVDAGSTNMATVAITGLTANDRLVVHTTIEASSQAVANPQLYHATDGVSLLVLQNSVAAGTIYQATSLLTQRQGNSTGIIASDNGVLSTPSAGANLTAAGVTTAWTGSWSLAFRHTGVTAGGTAKFNWAVYRFPGQ